MVNFSKLSLFSPCDKGKIQVDLDMFMTPFTISESPVQWWILTIGEVDLLLGL